MGYSKTIIQGNLTKDNELKYLPSGSAICKNSIAVTEKFKKQDGSTGESTMFIDFTVFGKRAEVFHQYTKKGSKILIDGKLDFQQWAAQDGSKRSKHAIKVDNFTFLDAAPQNGQQQQGQQNNYQPQQQQNNYQQQNGQQNNYNNNQSAAGAYQQGQNLPTINVDSGDEIPF